MTTIVALALLIAAPFADAQEGLERAAEDLAGKLATEGPAAKLAEVARTEAGRRALAEALRESVAWKLRPYEQDPLSHFELHLFTRGEDGTLQLRPERRGEIESMKGALERARAAFEAFSRRADAFAGKLAEVTEIDKRMKSAWQDPEYRRAVFSDLSGEGEERSLTELIEGSLRRDAAGKAVVREDKAEEIEELADEASQRLDRGLAFERPYLACVDRLQDPEARAALGSDFARAFVRARMGRGDEEDGDLLKRLLLRYGLVDGEAAALAHLRKDVEEGRKLLEEMKPRLDEIAGSLAEDGEGSRKLKKVLGDEASRAALVEQALVHQFEGGDPVEEFFVELAAESFEPRGDGLGLKEDAFAEDGKPATVEEVERGIRETVEGLAERRRAFADMAERCADASVAEVFTAPLAAPILERRVEQVKDALLDRALEGAVAAFVRRYMTGTGDRYHWRPDRAAKADAIVARAREISKEMEAEAGDDEKDGDR